MEGDPEDSEEKKSGSSGESETELEGSEIPL
jgi:hypothetical protein